MVSDNQTFIEIPKFFYIAVISLTTAKINFEFTAYSKTDMRLTFK